jgi:hypothetical protein
LAFSQRNLTQHKILHFLYPFLPLLAFVRILKLNAPKEA